MCRFTRLVLILLLVNGAAYHALAFSLLGPAASWMTIRLGYNTNPHIWPPGQGWGGGGPMNLGEEFRLNFGTVSYGFSPAFLNYFGQRGVDEIEKAVAILNALPSVDTININDYPLSSQRVNHKAQAMQLLDVRSTALTIMLNEMGLTDPTRWVFTLRNRWTTPASTNFYVIKRNFDPDTWAHSSYINGQLWTYVTILDGDTTSFVVTQPVDPLALAGLINAPVASGIEGTGLLLLGGFWTGLTRDDVGGLRYIYRRNNYNIETAPTNSFGAGIGAPIAGGTSSPWTIPVFGTNVGGVTIPGATTNFVNTALRPGIGRVQFVRVGLESQLGPYLSNTVRSVDRYITNGVEVQQSLVRASQVPDIIFDAGDLQGDDAGTPKPFFTYAIASLAWPSAGNGTNSVGPGTIPPSVGPGPSLTLIFQNVGPTIWNIIAGSAFLLSEENNNGRFFLWGSFDGSAEEPFVYPLNTSIEQVEQLVLGGGGRGGGAGGGTGSLVEVWTPAAFSFLPPGSLDGTLGGGGGAVGGGDGGAVTLP